jgi:hypothetical protein
MLEDKEFLTEMGVTAVTEGIKFGQKKNAGTAR